MAGGGYGYPGPGGMGFPMMYAPMAPMPVMGPGGVPMHAMPMAMGPMGPVPMPMGMAPAPYGYGWMPYGAYPAVPSYFVPEGVPLMQAGQQFPHKAGRRRGDASSPDRDERCVARGRLFWIAGALIPLRSQTRKTGGRPT
jgi:hypothetical protein